jgi:hypothetical protein
MLPDFHCLSACTLTSVTVKIRTSREQRRLQSLLDQDPSNSKGGGSVEITAMSVDLSGNLILEEVLNSVTHGLGILMCLVACSYLNARASEYGIREVLATAIFSASLMLLYTASTLYHAFFCCKATSKVFMVLDHRYMTLPPSVPHSFPGFFVH